MKAMSIKHPWVHAILHEGCEVLRGYMRARVGATAAE
jgi:hypothetical protein